jgi:serine/threonine-protein kinase RsbW/sigma-B regulation protein RsbU (phosphoserine phosphatase)
MTVLHITAEQSHLRDAMIWLDTQCAANRIAGDDATRLAIVLEELLVNVTTYNGAPPPAVELTFTREPLAMVLVIDDDGVAFDPTTAEPPNLSGGVEERAIGGLGVHMVMNLMDEVTYAREGNHNRLVLRKFLVAT